MSFSTAKSLTALNTEVSRHWSMILGLITTVCILVHHVSPNLIGDEKCSRKRISAAIEDEATCVPSVGMFMFFKERSNYSVAYNVCASMRGNLAHIASEVRNVELAKFLRSATNSSVKERAAFVGLNEAMLDKFFTSNDEPLGCFDFRAWAPGHPPEIRKPGCVGITPESSWKVFNCSRRMMFFCELLTSGPNPYVNNINQKCSAKRPNNRFIPKKALKVMR